LAKLQNLPSVESAALSDWVPLSFGRKSADVVPEGYEPRLHESLDTEFAVVSPGYFNTMKIPLDQGREFTLQDKADAPMVAIIDESMEGRYSGSENILGRRLRIDGRWATIVGVVRNTKHQNLSEHPLPIVYLPLTQNYQPSTIIHLRTTSEPETLIPQMRRTAREMDPRIELFNILTLKESVRITGFLGRVETAFAGVFGIVALILAAIGIYGVVAYRTQQRTHEIGIRVALGASSTDVVRLVIWQGMRMVGAGLAVGLVVALWASHLLRGLLYGVSAMDPVTMIGVPVLLTLAALLACYLPALKALRISPTTAMRAE
jgi:predicted permease